jgi:hypothetical protein
MVKREYSSRRLEVNVIHALALALAPRPSAARGLSHHHF